MDIYRLAEDLYYNEDKSFCPICVNCKEGCNFCMGLDFHREFVDLEKANKYFGEELK